MPKFGFKHTEETKKKISLSGKGRKLSAETKKNMSKAQKGISRNRMEKNSSWRGGKIIRMGYFSIRKPNHPFANNGYVFEHRLIIEHYLKRYLKLSEQSHHINKDKLDNRLKNLMVFINNSAHHRFHKNPNTVKASEIVFDGRLI